MWSCQSRCRVRTKLRFFVHDTMSIASFSMLGMPVATVVGDVSVLIFPMAETPAPEIASISAVVIASWSTNSDTCCVSLVQEGFVGRQPCEHPVDVAGEINYADHKKCGIEATPGWLRGWYRYILLLRKSRHCSSVWERDLQMGELRSDRRRTAEGLFV